jgi:hypothetical protein
MNLHRRSLLTAALAALAAPAIVRAESLMRLPPRRLLVPVLWGDGLHDDTAALQLLIDNARGQDIEFPPGTYKISSPLRFDHSHVNGNRALVRPRPDFAGHALLEFRGDTVRRLLVENFNLDVRHRAIAAMRFGGCAAAINPRVMA